MFTRCHCRALVQVPALGGMQGKPERTRPSPSCSATAPPGELGREEALGFVLPPAPLLAPGAAASPEEGHHCKPLFRPLAKRAWLKSQLEKLLPELRGLRHRLLLNWNLPLP